MSNKRIVEINGVKLEIDLNTAKRIDEFKIGDNVKVLKKQYSDTYSVYPGVIVEFVNFKNLPTIVIAYLKDEYGGTELEFLNFNAQTEDIEVALVSQHELTLEKSRVIDKFNSKIDKLQTEHDELIAKRNYFQKYFHKYFEQE